MIPKSCLRVHPDPGENTMEPTITLAHRRAAVAFRFGGPTVTAPVLDPTGASDGRVDSSAGNRSVSRSPAVPDPGPGFDLRRILPPTGPAHGRRGRRDRLPLALAKSLRRAPDRLDPSRVPRTFHRTPRSPPATNSIQLPRVLSRITPSSFIGSERPDAEAS